MALTSVVLHWEKKGYAVRSIHKQWSHDGSLKAYSVQLSRAERATAPTSTARQTTTQKDTISLDFVADTAAAPVVRTPPRQAKSDPQAR